MLLAYARKSTTGQQEATIEEQVARCQAIATMRGEVGKFKFKTYVDRGVSGSVPLKERPAGKALLRAAEKGDVVCASKLDRIFRSASDALAMIEEFNHKGIGLIICDMGIEPIAESPSAKLFFGMLSLVAQFERERISERIHEGKVAKRARGGCADGAIALGYRKVGTGRAAMLELCEKEQQHIQRALALSSEEPRTLRGISAQMADEGMLARNGKPYRPMQITRLVSASKKFKAPEAAQVPHG